MAKTVTEEDIRLNIIANGDPLKKELGKVEKAMRELNIEHKDLVAEKKKLLRANKKGGEEWKRVTASLSKNNQEIKEADARMKELRKEIGITGLTMRQLRAEAKRLRLLKDTSTEGTAAWKLYNAELNKVKARMNQVNKSGQGVKSAFGSIAKGFNKFAVLGASVIATLIGIGFAVNRLVQDYLELTDLHADVRKTTGLTKDEMDELQESLHDIDTRSSNENLLGLSRIAGKLGVEGKENIEGFTKAADQINVALGEDLGGNVEETIRQVGKLTDIFDVSDEFGLEEGMLKIGSAINSLGASSTASEEQIVEFAKRVGGIAKEADVAIADVLGLGATLDILGQKTEASGTVINKILVGMFTDTADFAKVAGLGVDEFTELLNTDSNEAMILFLEGLKGNNLGLGEMAERLDIVDQNGARSTQVLATLAGGTDTLREQQALANEEFEKGTSLTEEFNIKNNTMAARLDKSKKKMKEAREEIGEKLAPVMITLVDGAGKLLKIIVSLINGFVEYRKIIIPVTAAIIAYTVAIKLTTIAKNLKNIATIKEIFLNSKLGKGLKSLWKTMIANPYAAVAAVTVAAATALFLYLTNTEKATSKQALLNDAMNEANKATAAQKGELEGLLDIAKDVTLSDEQRQVALDRIKESSDGYLESLTLQNIATEEGIALVDNYVAALDRKALAQALESKLVELYKKEVDKTTESLEESTNWFEQITSATVNLGNAEGFENSIRNKSNKNKIDGISIIKDEIASIQELRKEKIKSGEIDIVGPSPIPTTTDIDLLTDKEKKAADKIQKIKDNLIAALKAMDLAYERSLLSSAERQLQDIRNKAKQQIEVNKKAVKNKVISEEVGIERIRIIGEKLRTDLAEKELELNEKTNVQILSEDVQNIDRIFSLKEIALKQQLAEQLTLVEGNEEAQTDIKADFAEKNKELQRIKFEETLALMEETLKRAELDIDLLPDEKKDELIVKIEELKLKIAELTGGEEGEEKSFFAKLFEVDQEAIDTALEVFATFGDALKDIYGAVVDFKNVKDEERLKLLEENHRKELEGLDEKYNTELNKLKVKHGIEVVEETDFERDKRLLEKSIEDEKIEAEEAFAAKKLAIDKQIFQRNKDFQTASAIIDGAAGVVTTLASVPYPANLVLAALHAGLTAAEVVTIQAQTFAKGKNMDVVGENDGKNYKANYTGPVKTGYYSNPSLGLFAEKEPEIVIDGQTTRNIMQFDPGIWDAINHWRAPQYADGKNIPESSSGSAGTPQSITLQMEFPKFIKAVVDQQGVLDIDETMEEIRTIQLNAGG